MMEKSRRKSAIAIVAKQTEPGKVKTRLFSAYAPREAAVIARLFLDDSFTLAKEIAEADVFIGFDPESAADWFKSVCSGGELISQGEGDLGARLTRLSGEVFALGYEKVILMGTDTPFLRANRFQETLRALKTPRTVVLGPAFDGGYYLIGLTEHLPELFDAIPWSSDKTLAETLKRVDKLGLRAHLLEIERDVDTPEDLQWMLDHWRQLGPNKSLSHHLSKSIQK